jgi:hypothetical protein
LSATKVLITAPTFGDRTSLPQEVAMEPLFAEILDAAKLAAETYNRCPSTANAEKLDAAWRTILKLADIARLRRAATERVGPARPSTICVLAHLPGSTHNRPQLRPASHSRTRRRRSSDSLE